MKFISIIIHIQEGDIITSKKGFLQKSALSDKAYIVKKQKFIGKGEISNNALFETIGDKVEVNISEIK